MEENRLAIIIVVYNSKLILKQVECIRKYCRDEHYDIIVVDNSDQQDCIDFAHYHSTTNGCIYMKTQAGSSNGSDSHAFAINVSYGKYKDEGYRYFFYLDHDNFPIKDFSVKDILTDYVIAGLGQTKTKDGVKKDYYWPGCVMFDKMSIEEGLIDMSPNNELGLDTGGNLYKVIDHYGDKYKFFTEEYLQNSEFSKSQYDHYALIHDKTFMHFVNASNWNNSEHNEERVNSLLAILERYITTQ